jgi:hypothetical protein
VSISLYDFRWVIVNLGCGLLTYFLRRRVWARKPLPEELAREASVKEEEETLDIDPFYIKQEPQE